MSTPLKTSSEPLLHEENTRLQRAVQELSVLNDLALAIGGLQSSREVIQTIIHRSLRAVDAEQGVITLVEDSPTSAMHTLVRTMDGREAGRQFHLDQQLLGWMHLHKQALLINSPSTDERFKGVHWDPSIRSVLAVPLMVKSKLRGLLTVYNKNKGAQFSPEDQRLLAILASQSAQILENARLVESEKELHLMQEDLRVAALIQQNLLPHASLTLGEYDIHGITIPAQLVGGDYFDYFPISASRLGLALGDVSGKGLPASLLMANVQATLRGQALWVGAASECVARANQLLFLSTSADRFVTLFFAVLDAEAHTLTYCNAGHEPPIFMSASGTCSRLETGGPLLGVVETANFQQDTVALHPGDTLLVFSDGFSEAMNLRGELLGDQGILDVVKEQRGTEVQSVVSALLHRTELHAGAAPQSDDRTALAVRRRSAALT